MTKLTDKQISARVKAADPMSTSSKPWKCEWDGLGGQVHPLDDLRQHNLGAARSKCWCVPFYDDEMPTLLIHNAADGREHHECGRIN